MKWLLDNLLGKYQRHAFRSQRERFWVFYLQIFNYNFCLSWFSKELEMAALLGHCCLGIPSTLLGAHLAVACAGIALVN